MNVLVSSGVLRSENGSLDPFSDRTDVRILRNRPVGADLSKVLIDRLGR